MTRQHFEMIAALLRETLAPPSQVEAFADALAATNDRFDRDRFVAAALPETTSGDDHLTVRMRTGNASLRDEFEMAEWSAVREAIGAAIHGAFESRTIMDRDGNSVGAVEAF